MRTDMRPADALLAEVEPLAHAERRRRVADLRRLAGGRDLVPLLVDLGQRGPYERGLALALAAAARDEASREHIAVTARVGPLGLAGPAVRLAVRFGAGAGELLDLLADASAPVRKAAWSAVRKHRRDGLADALVDRVAERWGAAEAASLLPTCRPAAVASRLEALAPAVPSWKLLGRAHPDLVLDHAERAPSRLRTLAPGLAEAAHRSPARVVALLEHLDDLPAPLAGKAGVLMDAEPERMLRVLLGPLRPRLWLLIVNRRCVRTRLRRYGDDDLAAVARAVHEHAGGARGPAVRSLLRAVPPGRRERLFAAVRAAAEADGGRAHLDALLDLLPRPLRAREARRNAPRGIERDLPLFAHLPYAEARPLLEGMTHREDADARARGAALLIRCAERDGRPETLSDALRFLHRVDPAGPSLDTVALALYALPDAALRAEHAAAVERFARRLLDAREDPRNAMPAVDRLAAGLVRTGLAREDPAVLERGLGLLHRRPGFVAQRLDHLLPRGRETFLSDALAPYLGDHRFTLLFANLLGRRTEEVPSLRRALARTVDEAEGRTRDTAITLWLAPPRTRADRVARVVSRHPSAVAVPSVLHAIATERTDLLDLVLTPDLDPRRIHPAWTRRWTSRQRDSLALLARKTARGGVQSG
ncbi:hypothetical protein [Actinomadura rifamycini]|uniref:hypothetical protein n=1 Tax=Actinomadura rifamycini TaxID=31962 RepID=UPI0012FB0884|nr:hypothetical protein [Actinomadura rifamycini]